MNNYQKDLITEFINDLIYDSEGRQSGLQCHIEDRAELAVKLKQLRDGPTTVMRSPDTKNQPIESYISKSLRDSLRNDSLENYSDSKDAKDLFPGL